jgi:hypothetical protein
MPARRKRVGRPGYKARRTAYKTENRKEKNKQKRQERHLKKHPNDIKSKGKIDYTRKKPLTPMELLVQRISQKERRR